MTTAHDALQRLAAGGTIGPVTFAHRNGRLYADVLDRAVTVDADGESIRFTTPAPLPDGHADALNSQAVAAALAEAEADLAGLSTLSLFEGRILAWHWISSATDAVGIASAARETVQMCKFGERVVGELLADTQLHQQIAKLEAEYG